MTTRADIMNNTNQEEAFRLIEGMEGWNQKRKNGEKAYWKRKHAPETINRNPSKGNRGTKININPNAFLDLSMEEFQKLKEEHSQKYVKAKEEIEEKIKKHKEQIEKLEKDLEEINKKIR